ncbi:hypothetical protein [Halorussus sp. AFM4]|uniref:hypothetical protein n=1 Tax=Halorussus sp. AFM4 TaxID=3421651 RepID=UPI003EB98ADE
MPRLETGLTVLDRPARRSPALHRLALAELAERDGAAYWLDARNEAATYALYDLAPSRGRLSDVRVARAFTAYQHHELVREVARTAGDAGLVVAPCVASLYRDDDVPEWEAADLFESSLAVLSGLAESLDAPVLTTADRDAGGPYADLLADRADAEIECTRTDAGLKYVADGFETTVYLDDGFWQTTIPYWVELLGAVAEDDPAVAAEAMGLADGVGV